MTQRNTSENEEKRMEDDRSFNHAVVKENQENRNTTTRNRKFEQTSESDNILSNKYRDNDLYERQSA